MICELCGREVPRTRPVRVEGSVLSVCSNCEKFGEGVARAEKGEAAPTAVVQRLEMRERRAQEKDIYEDEGYDLAQDYAEKIRKKREALGLSQEQLGNRLNERKSVIQKVETGALEPDEKLLQKLEKALGTTLREKRRPGIVQSKAAKGSALTLGDLIKFEE
ncbi:MAG: TIGR00270 family protein [Euryarchaeota archaeon]|nr:TIGR00270 family protein [Euryarchaeota archaeon]